MSKPHFQYPRLRQWVLAVDSMDEVLLLLDEYKVIAGANRALTRWGLSEVTHAVGRPFHEIVHPGCDSRSCFLENLWYRFTHYLKGKSRVEQEINDEVLGRWLHVSLDPIRPPENKALAQLEKPFAMMEIRDISALRYRKEMEERRTRFEAFNFVLRGLAHEIGNPLAAMRTTVEVLRGNLETFPSEKVDTYLQRVIEGTERLQAIVDRTLRSKYFPALQLTAVPLSMLLERMQRLFEDELKVSGIHFQVQLPRSKKHPKLLLDLTATEEVIVNLVKNSREACKSGDKIHISYEIKDRFATILICDSGKGMDQRELTSLFLPLFSSKPGGLGLGLAYSNYLVNKMGGRLEVESKPGKGTTIRLLLLLAREEGERPPNG